MVQASSHKGGCPTFTQMGSEFDVGRYMGRWYEVVRDMYIPFEVLSSCVNADYTLNKDGKSISVHNKGYNALLGWKDV